MNSIPAESCELPASSDPQILVDLTDLGDLLAPSLPLRDVFRAISVRICSILKCDALRLFLLERDRKTMFLARSWGRSENGEVRPGSAALECLSLKEVVIQKGKDFQSVAIPVFRGSEILGVMELDMPFWRTSEGQLRSQCNIISEIVSPAVVNAIIYERNQAAAYTDLTTQLPNKAMFDHVLENSIAKAYSDKGGQVAVLAIDVDGFATINQAIGSPAGDEVLCRIANFLQRSMRETDLLGRSHADEFVVLLPDTTEKTALRIISRIKNEVRYEPWEDNGVPIRLQLHFGWAVSGKDGETASALLACARIRKNASKKTSCDQKVLLFPRVSGQPEIS